MLDEFLYSLALLSFVFELLALFLAFYFKHSQILFLSLAMLSFRLSYLFMPIFEANLLICTFLPLTWCLLCILPSSNLAFNKINSSKIALILLVVMLIFAFSFSPNLSSLSQDIFAFELPVLSEVALLIFCIIFVFLLIYHILRMQFYMIVAFVLSFVGFYANVPYFEFASLFFVFYMMYAAYRALFFDSLTGLKNEASLKRFLKGKEGLYFGLLKFEMLDCLQEKYASIYLKKISKILRHLSAKHKIFKLKDDFIFVFEDEEGLKFLQELKEKLSNTEITIQKERIVLPILIKSTSKEELNLLT